MSSLKLGPVEEFLDQPKGAERRMDLVGGAKTQEGDELLVHVEIELHYRVAMPARLCVYNRLLSLRRRAPVRGLRCGAASTMKFCASASSRPMRPRGAAHFRAFAHLNS